MKRRDIKIVEAVFESGAIKHIESRQQENRQRLKYQDDIFGGHEKTGEQINFVCKPLCQMKNENQAIVLEAKRLLYKVQKSTPDI